MRKWIGVGVISAAAIISNGLWVHAQNPRVLPSPRVAPAPGQDEPMVISGNDFGFRVDTWSADGTPVGKIVVRRDGKWVEVRIPVAPRRVTAR